MWPIQGMDLHGEPNMTASGGLGYQQNGGTEPVRDQVGLEGHGNCPLESVVSQLQVQVASFSSQVTILHERLEKLEKDKRNRIAASFQKKRGRPAKRSMSVGNDPWSNSNSSSAVTGSSPDQSPASAPILPRMENGFHFGEAQRSQYESREAKRTRGGRGSHRNIDRKAKRPRKESKKDTRSRKKVSSPSQVVAKTLRSEAKICNICKKEFPSSSAIVKHERSDHHEFRWSCRFCQKIFRHSESCGRHEAICQVENLPVAVFSDGQKVYPCTSCPEQFSTLQEQSVHRSEVHSERILTVFPNPTRDAFSCGVCGLVAATSSGLVRHIKGSHPNYNPTGNQPTNAPESTNE